MVTKTLKGSFYNPKRDYPVPSKSYFGEDEMMSDKQRRTLKNLIFERIEDSAERERWLSQMDDMTAADAEDAVFDFLASRWR